MRLISKTLVAFLCVSLIATSCKREDIALNQDEVSSAVLQQIAAQGFSTEGVRKVSNGYLVEGDIILTNENLAQQSTSPNLLIANEEQYRTTNLVNKPRTITVSVSGTLTGLQVWSDATNAAIARYNSLPNHDLTFQRITGGVGNIDLVGFDEAASGGYITLGSAGFPSGGNPYNQIRINTNPQAYGSNPNLNYVTSVIQHEVGHCIGFRHTDYFNRALSCGGRKSNERAGSIGATLIPGTPSGFDAESFMLACSNGGNRDFNVNDKKAMDYLY